MAPIGSAITLHIIFSPEQEHVLKNLSDIYARKGAFAQTISIPSGRKCN